MTLAAPGNAPWQDPPKHTGKWDKYGMPWAECNYWDWDIVAVVPEAPTEASGLPSSTPGIRTERDGSIGPAQHPETAGSNGDGGSEPRRHAGTIRIDSSSELPQVDENHSQRPSSATSNGTSRSYVRSVMRIRRDLGELAGWPGLASVETISLAPAIEVTMTAMTYSFDGLLSREVLIWSLLVSQPGSDYESMEFHVKLQDGKWKAYSDEIEAAPSLWLYPVHERENGSQHMKDAESKELSGITETREKDGGGGSKDDAWLRPRGTQERPSVRRLGPCYCETSHGGCPKVHLQSSKLVMRNTDSDSTAVRWRYNLIEWSGSLPVLFPAHTPFPSGSPK
ncbi:hypothetical protein VUR80DRAFT_5610 [Thermomyces stellatus]